MVWIETGGCESDGWLLVHFIQDWCIRDNILSIWVVVGWSKYSFIPPHAYILHEIPSAFNSFDNLFGFFTSLPFRYLLPSSRWPWEHPVAFRHLLGPRDYPSCFSIHACCLRSLVPPGVLRLIFQAQDWPLHFLPSACWYRLSWPCWWSCCRWFSER